MSPPHRAKFAAMTKIPENPTVTSRIWTIPNALSLLRLLGVPLFLWLLLGPHEDLLAVLVLAVSAFTDWLDGKLARALGQTSRLGQLLDPAADRLYILATLVAFLLRDIVPWWLVAALVLRDVVMSIAVLVLYRYGYAALQVNLIGKAATLALLYAFPLLLFVTVNGRIADLLTPIAWAFAIWGAAMYWLAAVLYLRQSVTLVRARCLSVDAPTHSREDAPRG